MIKRTGKAATGKIESIMKVEKGSKGELKVTSVKQPKK